MQKCTDATYFYFSFPRSIALIHTTDVENSVTTRSELFWTKILFPYARILCLVVRGGSWGLELGLGEPTTQEWKHGPISVHAIDQLTPQLKCSTELQFQAISLERYVWHSLWVWSLIFEVKSTYSLPLHPLGGGCTMPASTLAQEMKKFRVKLKLSC